MFIQTLNIKKTAQELDMMLYDIMSKSGIFMPISKTVFKYKDYLVIRSDDGSWNCFKVVNGSKRYLANTFLKISAFAYCKIHEKRQFKTTDDILYNDQLFEKNYIDSLSYKKTMKDSNDTVRKDTALWRYEIAHLKAKEAKGRIDRIFYSSIA